MSDAKGVAGFTIIYNACNYAFHTFKIPILCYSVDQLSIAV